MKLNCAFIRNSRKLDVQHYFFLFKVNILSEFGWNEFIKYLIPS